MFEFECPICLDFTVDPYVPPCCEHFNCRKCFNSIQPVNNLLSCPICRKQFRLDQIKPYEPEPPSMKYCLDLSCQPNSGCTKVHIDELCKNPTGTFTPLAKLPRENTGEINEPTLELSENATYCNDICCPGGRNAKCGKKHEEDLNLRTVGT
ncbi:hypothetical protein ECG_08118 [Echinococcus granulosus]|uniref:Zinc finger RING type n=1 Tax=Echinococcus granulosus TaxID=6210 RepID=A0A068WZ79_ECHGR|nr:hypothetical protein ECG_08118 [Echinococcus granulosus]CDS23789.1 Zinc finger RING type [Echinococcus granulosus]